MTFKPMTIDDIPTPVWGIDDMPNLRKSLGQAKADRIRLHCLGELTAASSRIRVVTNPHVEFMQDIPPHSGGPVDDIIAGIASLDIGTGKQLSAGRLHNLIQTQAAISTELIMVGLSVNKRQAQRYLAAVKLCIKHISNHRRKVDADKARSF